MIDLSENISTIVKGDTSTDEKIQNLIEVITERFLDSESALEEKYLNKDNERKEIIKKYSKMLVSEFQIDSGKFARDHIKNDK